jgi:hypothetical protein
MRKSIHALAFVSMLSLIPAPSHAGLRDWLSLPSTRDKVSPELAQKRAQQYLTQIMQFDGFTVEGGKADFSPQERKNLDRHVLTRIDRATSLSVVRVERKDVKGVLAIAGVDPKAEAFDPHAGYLAYLSLETGLVFPDEADRAHQIMAHLIGEPAMLGFGPEAGPLWKSSDIVSLRGYQPVAGQAGGNGQAQFNDTSGYQPIAGEKAPDEEEIPAWVIRGLHDLPRPDAKDKPSELGILAALTRRPGTSACRLTHVTGVGSLGKALFKDGHRLAKETEE